MTYLEKLQDARWQEKRLETLKDANWECEDCNKGKNDGISLHVHHRQYIRGRNPWEYDRSQLAVLCSKCHEKHHALKDSLTELLSRLDDALIERVLGFVQAVGQDYADTPPPGRFQGIEHVDGYALGMLRVPHAVSEYLIEQSRKPEFLNDLGISDLVLERYLHAFREFDGPTLGPVFRPPPEG